MTVNRLMYRFLLAGILGSPAAGARVSWDGVTTMVGLCRSSVSDVYDFIQMTSIASADTCRSNCIQIADQDQVLSFLPVGAAWVTSGACNCYYEDNHLTGVTTNSFFASTGLTLSTVSTSGTGVGPVGAGNGLASATCYPFTATQTCSSRIMLAFDRTYRNNVLQSIEQGLTFLNEFVDNLEFGGARMGFYSIRHHSLEEILSIDNAGANDQVVWQSLLADVKGGSKHRQTHFWTLFTTLADRVSETGTPSFILLITDGQLVHSGLWRKHLELKRKMQNRLGSDAPTVVCIRVRASKTSKFLEKVCDQIIYEGKESKTLEVQAQELATSVCSLP